MRLTILSLGGLAGAALAGAMMFGADAHASTKVYGGGMAEECSKYALAGDATADTIAVCDLALEEEDLTRADRAKTFINRAVMHLRRKQFAQCRKDLASAERLAPDIGETFINRGALYIFERRYAESVAEIDHGLTLNLDEPAKAYFNRGLAKEGLNDARGAYMDYRKAAQIAPDWPDARLAMARFQVTTK